MKKLSQLTVVEAGNAESFDSRSLGWLQSFAESTVTFLPFSQAIKKPLAPGPQLVLFHTDLVNPSDVDHFEKLQAVYTDSVIIIAANHCEEEVSLAVLEAGAHDWIEVKNLSPTYLKKAVVFTLRFSKMSLQLQQKQEQLAGCLEYPPNVAVQWYNAAAEVVYWNKTSERIFGWAEEEALGKRVDQLITVPDNEGFWKSKIERMSFQPRNNQPVEWCFRHRDGTEHWCISTLFPIPSPTEEPWFACMDVEITERKLMEQRLQESEERYHNLFNQASDAIFINDEKGRFLDVNERGCALVGRSREEVLRMSVPDVYTKEELANQPIMWKELMLGQRTSLQRNLSRANGTIVPVELTAQMFKPNRIMAIVRDISDRKAAEEALQRSEEKYRLLVEQQADAITIFNDKGRVLEANQSATQLLQYTEEEFRQMNFMTVFSPEDLKKNPVDFDTLKEGVSTIKQRRMKRKDGSIVETEVYAKRLWDGLFLASVRDLTERLHVQHQLAREKDLSDSIINSLPGIFFLFSKAGKHLRWNQQKELITGYPAAEMATRTPVDSIAPADKDRVRQEMTCAFANGAAEFEAMVRTRSGEEIPFYFSVKAIQYHGEPCLMGTGLDLSDVKYLEKELANQQVVQQKKIMQAMIDAEEKEKANLGLELHDNVNQILSVVKMYLSILASEQPMEGITLPQTIKLLNSAIDEIRALSHSLAVSYRFDAGLVEALREMVEKVKLARNFSISLVTPPGLDDYLNAAQNLAIYRIVQEQLSNIMKYAKATEVNVAITLVAGEVLLRIEDNGMGFDPARTEKGLGLNNITTRTEALGGKVTIVSAPGAGCHIALRIPLREESELAVGS